MNQYQIDGKTFAVIEGELWVKAILTNEPMAPKVKLVKRHYKTKGKLRKTERRPPGYLTRLSNNFERSIKMALRVKTL
jgi:hypothetical protein